MAFTPSIPTSFVPHPFGAPASSEGGNTSNIIAVVGYSVFAIAIASALGIFLYNNYLQGLQKTQDAALQTEIGKISSDSVSKFTRLHDRLASGQNLLDTHDALTGLLTVIGDTLPGGVRFSALSIIIDAKGLIVMQATGNARNFNSLGVASVALKSIKQFKGTTFSNISVAKDATVSFSLSSSVDVALVKFNPTVASTTAPSAPAAPVQAAIVATSSAPTALPSKPLAPSVPASALPAPPKPTTLPSPPKP